MSYQTSIERDYPYAFYSADVIAGAPVANPLVAGSGKAAEVGSVVAEFPSPVFQPQRKSEPFSLEVWFSPIAVTESTIVLGHSEYDGILYDGEKISFVVHLTTGDVEIEYYPPRRETFHVVADYNRDSMTLFVNGEEVGSYIFTPEERDAEFAPMTDADNLVSGASASGASRIVIDAIAIYSRNIKASVIKSHYEMGQKISFIMQNLSGLGGTMVELRSTNLLPEFERVWTDDWSDGLHTETDDRSGVLRPLAAGGDWKINVLVQPFTGSIIEWEGSGVTVEVSADAVTWTVATNGSAIPGAYTEDLAIRVTFDSLDSYISKLHVLGYNNQTISAGKRLLEVEGTAISDKLFYPIHNLEIAGAEGGSITLLEDTSGNPMDTYAIEMWVKPTGTSMTLPAGTTYLNGVAGAIALKPGQWNHVVVTFTGSNADIVFDPSVRYGLINYYTRALSAQDVSRIYGTYFGQAGIQFVEANAFTVSEKSPAYEIYAYEWSIVKSG